MLKSEGCMGWPRLTRSFSALALRPKSSISLRLKEPFWLIDIHTQISDMCCRLVGWYCSYWAGHVTVSWPIDIHCGASTQSWYFVVNFWHFPPAGWLILQLLGNVAVSWTIHISPSTYTVGHSLSRDILLWISHMIPRLILQLLGRTCDSKLNDPFWPIDIHCGASTQSWYFVVNFWYFPPAGYMDFSLIRTILFQYFGFMAFCFMDFSLIWTILAGTNVVYISGIGCKCLMC